MTCNRSKLDATMMLELRDRSNAPDAPAMMPIRTADLRDLIHDLELWREEATEPSSEPSASEEEPIVEIDGDGHVRRRDGTPLNESPTVLRDPEGDY